MIQACRIEALDRIGAVQFKSAISEADLGRLDRWSNEVGSGRPGERIQGLQTLRWLLDDGVAGTIARAAIGPKARAVRAILFNKTAANNWALGWHQDRTIAVTSRVEVPGFNNWNVKCGVYHVEPPFDLIERMVTARIHLDDVDHSNAPLLVAPGSHCFGRIVEAEIAAIVGEGGELACLAGAGDIWLYRTAIVHASKRAFGNRRRRVLQVDFSADELPVPLRWAT